MKTILSAYCIALLTLALGTASATTAFAQTTNAPSTTGSTFSHEGKHHHDSVLTANEKSQLHAARKAAFAADPSLKTERASLKQQFETLKGQGANATKDQKKALHAQARTFHQSMRAAELKVDPTLAPIFAKLDAAHQQAHHSL